MIVHSSRFSTFSLSTLIAVCASGGGSAAIVTFSNLGDWTTAVNNASGEIRLEDFSGFSNAEAIGGAERGPGMIFRTFEGTAIYPRVDNDSPYGGGWLVNRHNGGFNEFQNGFVIDFTEPTFAVSLNDNPNEAVQLRVYDSSDNLLGGMSNGTGANFLGVVSTDTPIAYATVINLPPEDGVFAIDNLRIGVSTIPEPSSALFVGLTLVSGLLRRSKSQR